MNKQKTEAWVRVLANMVYNYNGSDPKKPPYGKYGVLNAGETLKELLEESIKQERKRVIKEINDLVRKTEFVKIDNFHYEEGFSECADKLLQLLSKN